MKICIAQTAAFKGNIEKNIENHIKAINVAITNNADLIVFPELSLTGFEPQLAKELATSINDERLLVFQKISNLESIIICVGIPIQNNEDTFISMLAFQPNKDPEIYSKQHLHSDEFDVFTAGNKQLFIEQENTKIAFAICYETSIVQHAEYAHKNGANIYIASVLNSTKSIDKDIQRLSKIASTHKMSTFMSNYIGESGGYSCAGKSSIWNTEGNLVGQLNKENEGLLIYDTQTKQIIKQQFLASCF